MRITVTCPGPCLSSRCLAAVVASTGDKGSPVRLRRGEPTDKNRCPEDAETTVTQVIPGIAKVSLLLAELHHLEVPVAAHVGDQPRVVHLVGEYSAHLAGE